MNDPEAIFDIAAVLGFPIADAYRPGVLLNLERLLEQAALVMAAPLPDDIEPPTEFEP